MEIGVAVFLALLGLITIIGSLQVGIDWGLEGPKAGFFPFYLGVLIVIASIINFVQIMMTCSDVLFAEWNELKQVLAVVVPTTVYVAFIPYIGIYAASVLLIFKDEVRQVGLELGVPEGIVWRQPFPGPGLGIRIVGEVTAERLDVLRAADLIAREELTRPAWTARSGSARSCCSVMCVRSVCRATAAPSATPSCCARCRPRTR